MKSRSFKFDATIWTRNLILFAIVLFLVRFGEGLLNGARMNFFIETIGLNEGQVLWLEGIRELPGLGLIFIAALTMLLPLSRQSALSVFLMGAGYILYAFVGSYAGLLLAVMIASFGFHMWTPLNRAVGLSLSSKENAGRVLGTLSSVGSLAAIIGMGALSLVSLIFKNMPLTNYYIVGGLVIIIGSLVLLWLPKDIGATDIKPQRILIKKRYWLYYVLIFFSGARKLVLGSFITLMLVHNYDVHVWQISTLTLISSLLNIFLAPRLGGLVDRLGERSTMLMTYSLLALFTFGYAIIPNFWILMILWVLIKLVSPLGLGLQTYVYRTAPQEELAPTLAAGVTFDHISSVSMPFLARAVLPIIDYQGVFFASAVLILVSIPFARMLQVQSLQHPVAAAVTSAD
ncbi:MAG: MFS transporter [Anaerolineae bacterium]|nr:MFS transporter [Anaerolineae bacterium]